MNAASSPTPTQLPPPAPRWLAPSLIAIAFLAMLLWSNGTWPDPLVDFGTHCYVPWRLSAGDVLYRDIAYYNGPLSPYFNALLFKIFGVGIHTLEIANTIVLVIAITLACRLLQEASGQIAAAVGGLSFVLFFGFGQGTGIGNYNWITPYAHEFTHGLTLALAMLLCLYRYLRTNRITWLIAAGVACGLAFLTKAEPSAAAMAGGFTQLLSGLWIQRASAKRFVASLAVFIAAIAAMPILAALLLMTVVPAHLAWLGAAGSWAWVFDRRITSLPFYRGLIGLNDIHGNLLTILRWSAGYAVVVVLALLLARWLWRSTRIIHVAVFLAIAAAIAPAFYHIEWTQMARPLPLMLAILLILAARDAVLRRGSPDRAALRLAAIVLSLALLPKILLATNVYHYGFMLALPGALVLLAVAFEELPQALVSWGPGSPCIARATVSAPVLAAILFTLIIDHRYFATKQWTIAPGTPDSFRIDSRGLEVQLMQSGIEATVARDQTLAVFPQGLMLNYLSRRRNSTRYINFMPPEVLAVGEPTILAALKARPPDFVVLDTSTLAEHDTFFSLDQSYNYGAATLAWIKSNYDAIGSAELPPQFLTQLHLILMRHRVSTPIKYTSIRAT